MFRNQMFPIGQPIGELESFKLWLIELRGHPKKLPRKPHDQERSVGGRVYIKKMILAKPLLSVHEHFLGYGNNG